MTAKKSAKKSATGKPFTGADDPRRGRGPKKGAPNAGRPTLEFKAWCASMLDDAEKRAKVEEILSDPSHSAYATMWKAVADRAHGKPKEHVEVSGKLTLESLIVESQTA